MNFFILIYLSIYLFLFYRKLLQAVEELQREKAGEREVVKGVQKALVLIREAHATDTQRWDIEKTRLDTQIKEVNLIFII